MRAYEVVDRAVSQGVAIGVARAHKHVRRPSPEALAENIEREVMTALCEVLAFEETQ